MQPQDDGAKEFETAGKSVAYVPGEHCPRGRHAFDEDHGSWVRCVKCGSTRTKPKGMDLATWKLVGKVHCPNCSGEEPGAGEGCSTCGRDRFLTKNEFNYVVKMRAGDSPASRLRRVG